MAGPCGLGAGCLQQAGMVRGENEERMAVATRPQASGTDWAVKQGLIGGSIAGIVFAFVEMLGPVLMGIVAATLFGRLPSAPRRAWSTT